MDLDLIHYSLKWGCQDRAPAGWPGADRMVLMDGLKLVVVVLEIVAAGLVLFFQVWQFLT